MVSACVLVRTSHGKFDEVVKMFNQIKGIERMFPVLGRYDIVLDIESDSLKKLASTILRLGKIKGVVFTETLVEIK